MHERGVLNLTVAREVPVVAVAQLVDAFVVSVRFYSQKGAWTARLAEA